jgi:hypothetical protein
MISEHIKIKEYLLGGLDLLEREEVERRIIEEPDYADEALAAEDALIESYVDGELTDLDRERFRDEYLTSEERVRRVKNFATLRAAVVRLTDQPASGITREVTRGGFLSLLKLRPLTAMVATAVVILSAIGLWLVFTGPTALEKEYAELNRLEMSDLRQLGNFSAIDLVPGTFRSADPGAKIVVTEMSKTVVFRLPLNFVPPVGTRFDVDLLREGKRIFTVEDRGFYQEGNVNEVRVLMPRSVLTKGTYQVNLLQPGTQNAPVVYNFSVE